MPDPGTVFGPAVDDNFTAGEGQSSKVREAIPEWERTGIEVNAPLELTNTAEDLRKWVYALRKAYGEEGAFGKIVIDAGSYIRWGEGLHTVLLRQEQAIQRLTRPRRPIRVWYYRRRVRFGRWLRAMGRRIS